MQSQGRGLQYLEPLPPSNSITEYFVRPLVALLYWVLRFRITPVKYGNHSPVKIFRVRIYSKKLRNRGMRAAKNRTGICFFPFCPEARFVAVSFPRSLVSVTEEDILCHSKKTLFNGGVYVWLDLVPRDFPRRVP